MRHIAAGQGGAFIGGPVGALAVFANLDQFKVRFSTPLPYAFKPYNTLKTMFKLVPSCYT